MRDVTLLAKGAYTAVEAARFLGVSDDTVYRLVKAGHLAAFVPRGMKRGMHIRHADLLAYIDSCAGLADTG